MQNDYQSDSRCILPVGRGKEIFLIDYRHYTIEVESIMERTKLIAARVAKGQRENRRLSQQMVADEIGCSRESYINWERGLSVPQGHWLERLLAYYEVSNAADLDISMAPRRQVLQMIVGARAAGALMSFGNTNLSPEKFLRQCDVMIRIAWQHMNDGDHPTVESILVEYVPTLESLAEDPSRIQTMAASLTTQAKILQMHLATRSHNFIRRQMLGVEAVQFGEISRNSYLHAASLFWHGDTSVYCYQDPEEAIGIFGDGMKHLNGSMLLECKLTLNLAIANALQGNETSALNTIEQVIKIVPKYPEQDPAYPYVNLRQGVLEKLTGRVFLALARRKLSYAKKAHAVFEKGVAKTSHKGTLSQTLIHKADAACMMGDLHEYAKSLSDGMHNAVCFGDKDLQHKARSVLHSAPDKWKKEQVYQDLLKLF